ncbi:MAG: hypothetical protein KJ723_14755 [candidate division Zixibacteria bacterium]|nr:hypothetical protein [candidate division Zixibacteria bacterium]
MRCREVIRLLNEGAKIDGEAQQHIQNCPSCMKEAESAKKLVSALKIARATKNENITPLARIRSGVEAETVKEITLMSWISSGIKSRPRMIAGLGMVVVLLIVATLVPFTYEKTVAYDATFAGIESRVSDQTLMKAVKALGYEDVSINSNSNGNLTDYTVANLPSEDAIREVSAAFYTLTGFSRSPEVTPVKSKVSGTLYAQARDKLVEVQVDATGKTDDEIRSEIEARLLEQGITAYEVTVDTDADGRRQIDLSVEGDGDSDGKMEVKLGVFESDGNGTFPPKDCMDLKLEGTDDMSDAEVEAYIEQQLLDKGITNANATVTTGADGQRKVEVSCEKTN